MIEGKLKPTYDEEFKEYGHGYITVYLQKLGNGTVGEEKTPYEIWWNPQTIGIKYKDRDFQYKLLDLISEAVTKIEEVKQ